MTDRVALPSKAMQIVLALVFFGPVFAAAQSSSPTSPIGNAHNKPANARTRAQPGAKDGTIPRTPDGQPDLHGYWTSESFTPLERPAKYAGREFLTDAEAEAAQKTGLQRGYDRTYDDPVEEPVYDSTTFGLTPALEGFAPNKRTSLIVDPPDGRLPPRTPEAMKRPKAVGDSRLY